MEKVLRSLIHEKFSPEVRFQLELISRRRDIVNEEKQQEILRVLRENNIEGISMLGPGTNRYAIKIDGFVVKVATDHDGKIDNLKEFKMAKRLFPYVAKTYEVSENGTLLVAEYIQPFESYTEMCRYADRIREILRKLSAVYLIGDVGITSKNYVNWGIRVGTDDPVCLDFAYVYEVSSKYFICRHCKVGMLVPDKDFVTLFCNRKGCGKETTFVDIRAMIGNDVHNHEIGDLTEEGYVMDDSNKLTSLNEERSNYLVRKKKVSRKKVKVEEDDSDNFDDESELINYESINKEEVEMSSLENAKVVAAFLSKDDTRKGKGLVVRAKATITGTEATPEEDDIRVESEEISNDEPYSEEEFEERISEALGVAFSGRMSEILDDNAMPKTNDDADAEEEYFDDDQEDDDIEEEAEADADDEAEEVQEEAVVEEPVKEPEPVVVKATVVSTEPKKNTNTESAEPKKGNQNKGPKKFQKQDNKFSKNFIDSIPRALSRFSNRIGEHLHVQDAFGMVTGHIKDKKMYPETFYKMVQNAVFRSLAIFFELNEENVPNDNNNGTHKVFTPPEVIEGKPYERSLLYIKRIWNERELNQLEDSYKMKEKYAEVYNDEITGLQHDWIPILKDRLQKKIRIDHVGAQIICNLIEEMWCEVPVPAENEEVVEPEQVEEAKVPISDEKFVENTQSFEGSYKTDDMTDDAAGDDEEGEAEGEEDTEGDEDDSDMEDYVPQYLTVEVHNDDDMDIIRVISEEFFGAVAIPFYTKLNEVDPNKHIESEVDVRNGMWDWVIHTSPDMMFYTDDPEPYLDDEPLEMNQVKVVVVGRDEETGRYIMGVYYIQGIFFVDDENIYHPITDVDFLKKINNVIREGIAGTTVSHRLRNLMMKDIIVDESYIQKLIEMGNFVVGTRPSQDEVEDYSDGAAAEAGIIEEEDDEYVETEEVVETEGSEESAEISDAEAAAIAAVMNGSPVADEQQQGKTYKPFRRVISDDDE